MNEQEKAVAYCGLFCEECFSYKGSVADLARDLRKELRSCRFDKTAEGLSTLPFFKDFEDYETCYKVLGAMVKLRCRKLCRNGGGNPYCKIRTCCERKGYDGCWECDDFETCDKLTFLKGNHGDAHIKNMKTIKRRGLTEFLKGKKYWYVKPKD
jgi:hypothetical protein